MTDAEASLEIRKVFTSLTPREREALFYVSLGRSNAGIGRVLGISEHTVKFHVNNILLTTGAVSRAHLSTMAAIVGLLDPVAVLNARTTPQKRKRGSRVD